MPGTHRSRFSGAKRKRENQKRIDHLARQQHLQERRKLKEDRRAELPQTQPRI